LNHGAAARAVALFVALAMAAAALQVEADARIPATGGRVAAGWCFFHGSGEQGASPVPVSGVWHAPCEYFFWVM